MSYYDLPPLRRRRAGRAHELRRGARPDSCSVGVRMPSADEKRAFRAHADRENAHKLAVAAAEKAAFDDHDEYSFRVRVMARERRLRAAPWVPIHEGPHRRGLVKVQLDNAETALPPVLLDLVSSFIED